MRASATKPVIMVGLLVAAALLLVVLANVHFVYVAFTSQPACVAHEKSVGVTPGSYRAATSAC